ncbi:MAG: hypothetical protein ACR2PI_08850 [Hyphomicrobiaceae bacterium]
MGAMDRRRLPAFPAINDLFDRDACAIEGLNNLPAFDRKQRMVRELLVIKDFIDQGRDRLIGGCTIVDRGMQTTVVLIDQDVTCGLNEISEQLCMAAGSNRLPVAQDGLNAPLSPVCINEDLDTHAFRSIPHGYRFV